MEWLVFGVVIVALVWAVLGGIYYLIRRHGRKVRAEYEREFGSGIRLMTGCGVISGPNRVPGLMILLDDRLIYRAFVLGREERIPLGDVRSFLIEDTRQTRHVRARKYRRAGVLEINTRDGRTHLLVVSQKYANTWRERLSEFTGAAS